VVNAPLVPLLVFFQCSARVLGRMIVNEFVALRAEKHQIAYVVNISRPRTFVPSGSSRPEGHHMSYFGEVPVGQGQMVF
jgi:hypothetical protein